MADVCWSALRGRSQFVVESVGVVVVGCYISVVLCQRTWRWQYNYTVWSHRLGNAMFSSATFKRQCFPLASMSMPSNMRDRRVSSVLTSRARGYKSSP